MRLYVGNLPRSIKEKEFKDLFVKYTSVKNYNLIIDRETQQAKGFGFVEFENKEEAEQAIKDLHGKEVGGRTLVVNEARPQEKREFRGGGMGGGGGGGGGGGRGRFDRSERGGERNEGFSKRRFS